MSHEDLILLLTSIKETAENTGKRVDEMDKRLNGRLRVCENRVSTLNWAVFIGGGGLVSTVAYLVAKHLSL